jgi:hypothetical protein
MKHLRSIAQGYANVATRPASAEASWHPVRMPQVTLIPTGQTFTAETG